MLESHESPSESEGGLPPDELIETTEAALKDAARLINQYHDSNPYSMIRIGIAPVSPFSVDKNAMIEAATLAKSHPATLSSRGSRNHDHMIEFICESRLAWLNEKGSESSKAGHAGYRTECVSDGLHLDMIE
ncbi:hypothetical protein SeLEV6574_g00493 [Synchytrium endobioticum]|uniref:Uncharacterized protein n=1 Tax=Synchytrium endobioticum TaxID=286115 RepID=A0A507DHP1_9FUNG|nr:hypothetical protein SeLEV6574_g00493 [Synchytrium endobioticum]